MDVRNQMAVSGGVRPTGTEVAGADEAQAAPLPATGSSSAGGRFSGWLHSGDGAWIPLLVCAVGALFSVVAGSALASYEENGLESELNATGSELSRAVESRFNSDRDKLRELARICSLMGTSDVDRWASEAKLVMTPPAEIWAIEWDTGSRPEGPLTYGTPQGLQLLQKLRADGVAKLARKQALDAGVETFLGPFERTPGHIYELILPLQQGQNSVLVLSALVDPAMFLESVLSPVMRNCVLAVLADGQVLYQRGEPPTNRPAGSVVQETIKLPTSEEWTLSLQPSQSVLDSLSSRLPRIVLGAGLMISVLLAAMVRLGQVTWTSSQKLVQKNSEVHKRLRDIERVADRSRVLAATLRDGKQSLEKENVSLRVQAQTREQSAIQQDSIVAELEAFTYSVSHDLRSPLGAILNYAAALSEDYTDRLDESGRDHLARISSSARSAVAMMDGLLAFSRIGRHELKPAQVDMRELVRDVYEELRQAMPGRTPNLSMGEMPSIEADPTLLRVLMTNLLSNAFKFTRSVDEPRIEVGGYLQGSDAVYYVEDNGIGFDMRNASRLFRVFERLNGSSEYEGHGVGLAIVERIARRHGGSVRAEGVLGKGATFFITLPNGPPYADDRNAT